MSSIANFVKPPVIAPGKYSYFAEAGHNVLTPAEVTTFEHAVSAYSFVLQGHASTGAGWIARIGQAYDLSEPRNQEVTRVIKKAMLVEPFNDWRLVYRCTQDATEPVFVGSPKEVQQFLAGPGPLSERGQATFVQFALREEQNLGDFQLAQRGRLQVDLQFIDPRAQVIDSAKAKTLGPGNFWPAELFGLEAQKATVYLPAPDVSQSPNQASSLLPLMAGFALHAASSPVADRALPNHLAGQIEAEIAYLTVLANQSGASVWLRGSSDNEKRPGARSNAAHEAGWSSVGLARPDQVLDSAQLFMNNAADAGWQPGDSKVFLARPNPLVHSLQGLKPSESVIHPQFCGYRLTEQLVDHLYHQAPNDKPLEYMTSAG